MSKNKGIEAGKLRRVATQHGVSMPHKHPRLVDRNGTWTFRVRVPDHLREIIGKREIWKSVGRRPYAEAVKLARKLSVDVDAEFAAAERRLRGERPTAAEIRASVRVWFVAHEKAALRAESGAPVRDVAGAIAALQEDQALIGQTADDAGLYALARAVVRDRALNVQEGTREFELLVEYVQRSEIERLERAIDRLKGDDREQASDPLFAGLGPSTPLQAVAGKGLVLEKLIEKYLDDPGRARSTKTVTGYAVIFRALKELLGANKPVGDVTREDCRRVRDMLMKLPANATKRFPKLSLEKAAEKAEREGLPPISPGTATSYLQNLSALFRWAVQEGFCAVNPAEALKVADPSRKGKKSGKRPFAVEQLKAIFSAPLYTGCQDDANGYGIPGEAKPRRGRFWVPLLSLFHGLRLNEAAQLHTSDVKELDGVPCILVRETGDDGEDSDKRVKTEAGERFVPVHPEVIALGFLDFVADARKRKATRLFPDLPIGANGYASDPFSKWFGRFLEKAGAARPGTSFHSFRHSYRDALREAGVSLQAARALGGWADTGGADALYGEGLRPSTLRKEIEKVAFPGLDLSHLRPE